MAFTNSSESTTDDLASLEKERSARGSRSDPLPLLAIFAQHHDDWKKMHLRVDAVRTAAGPQGGSPQLATELVCFSLVTLVLEELAVD